MKIIVDAMGGDKGPLEILRGCELAIDELGIDIVLVGDEKELRGLIEKNRIVDDHIELYHADQVLTMEDTPVSVLKEKSESSMAVALRLLHDGYGNAVVSTGNTGALLAGGTLIVKRIKGIKRAALAPVLPTKSGKTMIIDSGANVECRPEFLNQFGLMGSIYMENVLGFQNPRVGLANNGSEETKGTELCLQAYDLLQKNSHIHFVGNVEGRGVMLGECEVLVTDGFTGNLILKSCEGAGVFMIGLIKELFLGGVVSKFAALLVQKQLRSLKRRLDYTEVGGAVLLGVQKPVVKAHGSSDAKSVKNAVRQAVRIYENDVCGEIAKALAADMDEA